MALAKRLSELPKPLSHYLRPITNECNEKLREPLQKQAKPARQILNVLSSASITAFTLVVQAVVAPLLTVYQDADGIAKQREILESFGSLFESAVTVFGTWNDRDTAQADNPLLLFKDQLTEILGQVLMGSPKDETSFRVTALKGYLQLCSLKNFLPDSEIGLFVQYLDEILLKEEDVRTDLRKEAIAALAEISKYKSRLIMDITFPAYISALPDTDAGKDAKYINVLESLAQISTEKDVFETLVRRLLTKLDILLSPGSTSTPAYPRAILMTILYAMECKGLENDANLGFYYNKIVRDLCQKAVLASISEANATPLHDATVLDTLGRLCNLIVRSLPRPIQEEACKQVYGLYSTQDGFVPVLFAASPSRHQRQTMILSTYLLGGLPKDIAGLPYTDHDMAALLNGVSRLALSEDNATTQFALVRQLALLVNKFLPTPALPTASDILSSLLSSAAEGKQFSPNTIRTIFWLSKALILRLAPSTTQILTSLLDLLSSPDATTSTTSARGFTILLSPDDVLSPKNGATIRLLSKQRVFTTLTPLISSKVRNFNTTTTSFPQHTKQAYLTALSGILSTIPASLVMPELPTLFPLLLQTLDLTGADSHSIKSGTLSTLAVIIRENGVRVIHDIGYVGDLVTRLLKTATFSPSFTSTSGGGTSTVANSGKASGNTPSVRSKALQCLLLLALHPTIPGVELTPSEKAQASPLLRLKPEVLRSLKLILDDPKRDVRKAAVDARAAWLRQVEDGKDDDED